MTGSDEQMDAMSFILRNIQISNLKESIGSLKKQIQPTVEMFHDADISLEISLAILQMSCEEGNLKESFTAFLLTVFEEVWCDTYEEEFMIGEETE